MLMVFSILSRPLHRLQWMILCQHSLLRSPSEPRQLPRSCHPFCKRQSVQTRLTHALRPFLGKRRDLLGYTTHPFPLPSIGRVPSPQRKLSTPKTKRTMQRILGRFLAVHFWREVMNRLFVAGSWATPNLLRCALRVFRQGIPWFRGKVQAESNENESNLA